MIDWIKEHWLWLALPLLGLAALAGWRWFSQAVLHRGSGAALPSLSPEDAERKREEVKRIREARGREIKARIDALRKEIDDKFEG